MKKTVLFLALIIMIACKDNDVNPIDDCYPLVKTITQYADDGDTPTRILSYKYDDRRRVIEQRNSDPGWFSSSLTTIEYISDDHVILTMGSSTYDLFFNERGDRIKMNEDIFAYRYEENKITMTITSDSDTWDIIYHLDNGNVIRTEEPDFSSITIMTYDNKPNYERSIGFGGSLTCANNVLSETYDDGYGDPYQVDNTYQYNSEGYVIEMKRTSGRGTYQSIWRYEIEYYNN